MPSLLLENVPRDLYESLRKRAAARQRPLPEEALIVLREGLQKLDALLPLPEYIPSEEISPPCDLPLPDTAVRVKARRGEPPLPDPIDDLAE